MTTTSPTLSPLPLSTEDVLNTTTDFTARNDTEDERNERLAVFEVALSGTILFLAVVGNSIVVVSLMVKRGKLSRMHLMMLHLSLADLSVAFFQVLPQMVWDITYRFQGGAFLCGAIKYLQLVTMYASSYVLLSTAVDRYVAICKPFLSHKWTSRHAHLLVLAAWLASLVFSLPQIFIFSLSELGEGTGVYDCWASFHPPWTLKLYITWNALSVFIAPVLTLAVLYGHITFAVWKSGKMADNLGHRYVPASKRQKDTATVPGQQANGTSNTSVNKNAWQTARPVSTISGNSTTCSSVLPGTTRSPESQQLPTNRGGCSHEAPLQTAHVQGDCTQTTYCGRQVAGMTQDSASSRDVPPSARLPDSCPGSQNVRGAGRSRGTVDKDAHGAGSSRSTVNQDGRGAGGMGISRAKVKTIKLTLTVVICYLVCWTPFYVAQLWAAFDENVPYENIFFTLVLLLASVNSCTNPWIYMVFSDTIWNTLRAIADSFACCFHSSSRQSAFPGRRHSYKQSAAYRATLSTSSGSNRQPKPTCVGSVVSRL